MVCADGFDTGSERMGINNSQYLFGIGFITKNIWCFKMCFAVCKYYKGNELQRGIIQFDVMLIEIFNT